MKRWLWSMVLFCLLAGSAEASIINGSFESGFANWTLGGTGPFFVQINPGSFVTPYGTQYAELGSPVGTPGSLSQSVTGLTVGQNYNLAFSVNWGSFLPIVNDNFLNVFWAGGSVVALQDLTSTGNGTGGWQNYSYVVNAAAATQSLQFDFGTNLVVGLDNVSLTPTFAAVPEPSSFALIGAIGAFGIWKRRRSQKAA